MKIPAKLNVFNRVSFLEVFLFTKHLSVMLKAGIPITESLSSLAEQAKTKVFRGIISSIQTDIENGSTLAESLKKYPQVFDEFYISLVNVGEESGTLEDGLIFLSNQLSRQYSLNQKIRSATLYPSVIIFTAISMGAFISFFIFPKLIDFFAPFETELPPTTKALIFFANIMKNYGVQIFVGIFVFLVLFFILLQIKKIRLTWHTFTLKLPFLGEILAYNQLARFNRNLGVLIKNGVSAVKSIEVTANTLSNLRFRQDVVKISESLSEGKSIGVTLKKYNEFPPMVSRMIAIGEKSGQLDQVLIFLGDFYEEEIDSVSKNLTAILEPLLLLIIGFIVGFIALAIITPIYELTGGIAR